MEQFVGCPLLIPFLSEAIVFRLQVAVAYRFFLGQLWHIARLVHRAAVVIDVFQNFRLDGAIADDAEGWLWGRTHVHLVAKRR